MYGARKKILFLVVCNVVVWFSAACLGGRLSAQATANAQSDKQTQIDKGRIAVGQTCATCHAGIMRMAQAQKQNQEQWKDTIYSMIGRGAEILPDEIEPISAFLAATSAQKAPANAQTAETGGGGRGGRGGGEQQGAGGDGRAILQRTCQQCHDLATAQNKAASEDWNAVIAKMTGYGVRLTPADQQKLIDYLNGLAK